MDIWIAHCKRIAKCHYCEKHINVTEPMVTGKLWRKKKEGLLHWVIRYYWHPLCWVEEGLNYLSKNPYNQGNRGGQPLNLSHEDRIKRLSILRRHAKYTQKIRQSMERGDLDRIIRLASSMEKLKEEILPLGGIPKKWLTDIEAIQSTQKN